MARRRRDVLVPGLGSAMIAHGEMEPMELAHMPYRKHSYEYYVSEAHRKKHKSGWEKNVLDVVAVLRAALEPDDVVLGGGNVAHLKTLPDGVRRGDNALAFRGGFRVWDEDRT